MQPFLRGTGAVVAGYAAIFITLFATFNLAYWLMGPDRAFEPGTYDVSPIWIALTIVVGWIAATLGGKVCSAIAGSTMAPKILIVLVGILGAVHLVTAYIMLPSAPAERLAGEPAMMEAMNFAVEPLWIIIINPIIGMIGVAWGSGLLKKP